MGGQEDGHTQILLNAVDDVPNHQTGLRIQASRWFIQKQDFWPLHQRPANIRPAPLTTRKFAITLIGKVMHIQKLNHFVCAFSNFAGVHIIKTAPADQIFTHGEFIVQNLMLKNNANLLADCVIIHAHC